MKSKKTFSDIDLNFIPNPSSQDRYLNDGTISCANNSKIISGTNTTFTDILSKNDNLYVNNSFIGKIESIESNTSLTLQQYCKITKSIKVYDIDNTNYDVIPSSISTMTYNSDDIELKVSSSEQIKEGQTTFFVLTTKNIPDGTHINYRTYGIIESDIYVKNVLDPLYGNIQGYFLVTDSTATVQFTLLIDSTSNSYRTLVLELIDINVPNSSVTPFLLSIHNSLFMHSTPADIALKYDTNAIRSSIKNLVLTMNYERKFNSKLGSQVKAILFEPSAAPMTYIILKKSIIDVINSYEPRASLISVDINTVEDSHSLEVIIIFNVINTSTPIKINMILDRTR